jgi:polyether ionophore transport system permease protein
MEAEAGGAPAAPAMQRFRSPRTVVARFVGRGVSRSAAAMGFYFGVYVALTAIGFVRTYKSTDALSQLVALYGNNASMSALAGVPHGIDTVNGLTVWKLLVFMCVAAGIWAIVVSTKRFRGEESAGRLELFLSGQASAKGVAANILGGLGLSILVMYVLTAVITIGVGRMHDVGFSVSSSLFFALAGAAAAAEFVAVGALASQIAPTRRRAAGIASVFLVGCYLLRGIGDAAPSLHWLTGISPLGWIENMRPLTGSDAIWLLPITGFVAALCALTVYLAGKRDLGASILPDKDTAPPRTKLLNSSLGLTVRETRSSVAGWLAIFAIFGMVMGAVAKSAGEALSSSPSLSNFIKDVAQAQLVGTTTYLGLMFLIFMTMMMGFAAMSVAAAREDEAEGFLENLVVRLVSRVEWLGSRLLVIVVSVVLAGLVAGVFTWFGTASQRTGIAFGKLLVAGLNAVAPAMFIVGVGILVMGIKPRWTSIVLYIIIGWSFLLQLVGPSMKLNHWILDTGILYHVALAPATDPRWGAVGIMIFIGAASAVVGGFLFNRRDLAGR